MSSEEISKLDKQRAEFFKETENTRQKLYEKELALRSELAKENPDTSKASNLQGEISKLQSDLDQKRLDYEIQARKSVRYDNLVSDLRQLCGATIRHRLARNKTPWMHPPT